MNIGIVTTWFERGAAIVSKAYLKAFEFENNKVFIFARGGEKYAIGDDEWDKPNVTWGKRLVDSNIDEIQFFNWIDTNKLDVVLFNEQRNFKIVAKTKKKYQDLKIGAYVDYYTEKTIRWFNIYDFLICNTKRHMEAMDKHPQSYYLKWGTDTELYRPSVKNDGFNNITFFHSVGMSQRKGTDVLVNAFIDGKLYKTSKLIIHTQIPINMVTNYRKEDLDKFNIQVIEKTVTAPGLYYMGDIYVYPTRLDGLGLTMYEALASGLPVITTNYPPMNEIIDDRVGKMVEIERNYCRYDGYYWPMAVCSKKDLIKKMRFYIDNPDELAKQKINARRKAEDEYNWMSRAKELTKIINEAKIRKIDMNLYNDIISYYKHKKGDWIRDLVFENWFLYFVLRKVKKIKERV